MFTVQTCSTTHVCAAFKKNSKDGITMTVFIQKPGGDIYSSQFPHSTISLQEFTGSASGIHFFMTSTS